MTDDPVVEEVHRIRAAIAKRFNYDLKAICANAQRLTEEAARAGRKVASLPPRRPKGYTPPRDAPIPPPR